MLTSSDDKKFRDAFREGYAAYENERRLTDNPYDSWDHPVQFDAWEQGWHASRTGGEKDIP